MKIVSCTKITKLLSKNDLVLEETAKNSVIPTRGTRAEGV